MWICDHLITAGVSVRIAGSEDLSLDISTYVVIPLECIHVVSVHGYKFCSTYWWRFIICHCVIGYRCMAGCLQARNCTNSGAETQNGIVYVLHEPYQAIVYYASRLHVYAHKFYIQKYLPFVCMHVCFVFRLTCCVHCSLCMSHTIWLLIMVSGLARLHCMHLPQHDCTHSAVVVLCSSQKIKRHAHHPKLPLLVHHKRC